MSFKKTSEGRVYFQGSKKTANDWPEIDEAKAAPAPSPAVRKKSPINVSAAPVPAAEAQANSIQIVSLLRALNEKLQITQAERREMRREIESYRTIVENLQAKAGEDSSVRAQAAEHAAQEALRELEEARKLILQIETKAERADKGVSTLKTQLVKSVQKLEGFDQKQTAFEQKLADTEVNQAKMMRQVDKATEERTRFMRKIERIEEAVLQTQDALNARAMVLLTDQNSQGITIEGGAEALAIPRKDAMAAQADLAGTKFLKRPFEINSGAVTLILLLTILAGWGVSEMRQKQLFPDLSALKISSAPVSTPAPEETSATVEPAATQTEQTDFAQEDTSARASLSPMESNYQDLDSLSAAEPVAGEIVPEPELAAPVTAPVNTLPQAKIDPATNDIGAVDLNDDKQLLELLDKHPEALAEKLNALEPSVPAPVATAPAKAAEESDLTQVAYNAPEEITPSVPKEVAASVETPLPRKELLSRIKPDSSLPASLKDIQDKAYAGVPEAQHDLAAIYTAGHGGVGQDYKRASFWFEQAAVQNIPNAAYNLGVLYHQGLGVEKNLKTAISWYQKAASLGHPEAQYNLGIAYIEGIGVPYDAQSATRNFRAAADQGITEAAYNLGLIYENGLLGEAKPDEALMWYKTAADAGSPEARQALGQLAKTLGISLEEVNRIADSMKPIKKSDISLDATEKFADYSGQTQVLTAQVQEYLGNSGLYEGEANGFSSPETERAVRKYQADNGLEANGEITKNLLSHMLASGTEYGSRE